MPQSGVDAISIRTHFTRFDSTQQLASKIVRFKTNFVSVARTISESTQ